MRTAVASLLGLAITAGLLYALNAVTRRFLAGLEALANSLQPETNAHGTRRAHLRLVADAGRADGSRGPIR